MGGHYLQQLPHHSWCAGVSCIVHVSAVRVLGTGGAGGGGGPTHVWCCVSCVAPPCLNACALNLSLLLWACGTSCSRAPPAPARAPTLVGSDSFVTHWTQCSIAVLFNFSAMSEGTLFIGTTMNVETVTGGPTQLVAPVARCSWRPGVVPSSVCHLPLPTHPTGFGEPTAGSRCSPCEGAVQSGAVHGSGTMQVGHQGLAFSLAAGSTSPLPVPRRNVVLTYTSSVAIPSRAHAPELLIIQSTLVPPCLCQCRISRPRSRRQRPKEGAACQ